MLRIAARVPATSRTQRGNRPTPAANPTADWPTSNAIDTVQMFSYGAGVPSWPTRPLARSLAVAACSLTLAVVHAPLTNAATAVSSDPAAREQV